MVVEREPQPQQQAALQHAARHRRVADGAEQDRVVPAQLVEHAVGQRLARGVPAPGAEVVLRGLELDVVGRADRLEDAHGLGDDLGPDAVAGDQASRRVDGLVGTLSGRSRRRCQRRSMDCLDGLLDRPASASARSAPLGVALTGVAVVMTGSFAIAFA